MLLVILFLFFCRTSAVIYQLNETEYARMPPVFHLDSYDLCLHQEGGIYCTVDVDLVADDDNNLLKIIQEYSDRRETHFNHSRLHYGICVTKMCRRHIELNITTNLMLAVERCLNESFWNDYKLKTRINKEVVCSNQRHTFKLEGADIAVAVMCSCLVMLNAVGSIYGFLMIKDEEGNKWLQCFSMKRNWLLLRAPSGNGTERRFRSLKCLNGMKVITIGLVIMEHSLLPFTTVLDNTHFLETTYSNILYHLLIDGTVIVQTFFFISGCLLAYLMQVTSEKERITWMMIPKGILLRWLRLTPSYAVVLAITTTWYRFAGSGPLWQKMVGNEVKKCRHDGWQNMVYINNYYDHTQCMGHTWYLAADMQLYIIGIITLVLVKDTRNRRSVLLAMFATSLFIVPFHTYFQDLYAHIIITPEAAREHFANDATFNHSYKRGHTNVTNYILGLGAGLLIYDLQQMQLEIERYKKFKYIVWATVPVGAMMIFLSSLFYMDGVRPPLILRAIYSGIHRTVIGLLLFVFVLGMAFKLENVYRPLLEWQGWTSLARVSYSAYIIHVLLIQIVTYSRTTLIHITVPQIIMTCLGGVFVVFLVAVPFWLLIEAPFMQLVKLLLPTGNRTTNKPTSRSKKDTVVYKTQL